MQKPGGLAIFAYSIYYCWSFIKSYTGNYATIWESFQIMLPVGGTVVAFWGRKLALDRWNLQCLGANARGFPGVNPPGWPLISALRGLTSNGKRQRWTEFVFFSSNPSLNHIKIEKCLLLFATNTNIFTLLFKELKTDAKSFIFAVWRKTTSRQA